MTDRQTTDAEKTLTLEQRRRFMTQPLDERRRFMAEQTERMAKQQQASPSGGQMTLI